MVTKRTQSSGVVLLAQARLDKRLELYRQKLGKVMAVNKRAIGRLYESGALFTRDGSRAGRDLLLAHQHLLRVMTLVDRLSQVGDVPAPQTAEETDAVFKELDELLDRTTALTDRTSDVLSGLKD